MKDPRSWWSGNLTTIDERLEFGRRCRLRLHRVDQCHWARESGIDPITRLVAFSKNRVPELLPIKWVRMSLSPFAFFRGAVPLMAADLAASPNTGIIAQICGDAHVRNLGAYAAPDGRLIFDINDFDETVTGPWEWDVKRLATSIVLAGREARTSENDCANAVREFVATYRLTADRCSRLTVLKLARYLVRQRDSRPLKGVLLKAEKSTPERNLQKLTESSEGTPRFRENPPLLTRVKPSTAKDVLRALASYRQTLSFERRHFLERYRPVDVAFKVVGTGSVGTRNYVVLCLGNGVADALFLQVKEEPPSAYAPYVKQQVFRANEGQRVVEGQRVMQAQSDLFLGWTRFRGRDYLVRQLSDHKASMEIDDFKGGALIDFARVCGEILAKGHARSGDACIIAGYCGGADKLDNAIAQFAVRYADQTEIDHRSFLSAVKSGRLTVAPSVDGS
jgi:uncharacterized protein (DUF2252 family)